MSSILQLGAMLFILNLHKIRSPLLFVFLVCWSVFVMSIFFKKLQIWKISYVHWMQCV